MSDNDITNQLYRDIFLTAPFGIYTLDANGTITSFNPKMSELSGEKSEKVVGVNALQLDSYIKVGLDKLFYSGIHGRPFETEVTYTSHFTGKVTVRHYRGVPIADRGIPHQARLLLIVEDVTREKHIEKELKDAAQFTEENTSPLLRITIDGHILIANKTAKAILPDWQKTHPGGIPETLFQAIRESLQTRRTRSVDIAYQDSIFLFEIVPQPESGYANIYGRDVTEERKIQMIKDHFLAVTSHELRTPLTIINGYVDLILKGHTGGINTTQSDYLQKIQKSTNHLLRFVDVSLDINKLESGAMDLKLAATPINQPVEQAVENMQTLYQQSQLALISNVRPDVVMIDAEQFERIIMNLLSNALKFTKPGGSVTISSLDSNPNEVTISVADTGIGIDEKDQKLLFHKYAQIDNEGISKMRGTGLGLVICKELIEQMNGRIWLESQLGRGTTFFISLPRA